jgi:hypothetical protein
MVAFKPSFADLSSAQPWGGQRQRKPGQGGKHTPERDFPLLNWTLHGCSTIGKGRPTIGTTRLDTARAYHRQWSSFHRYHSMDVPTVGSLCHAGHVEKAVVMSCRARGEGGRYAMQGTWREGGTQCTTDVKYFSSTNDRMVAKVPSKVLTIRLRLLVVLTHAPPNYGRRKVWICT